MKECDGALGGFIGEELGEGEAAVIVDGDMEIFPTRAAGVVALPVAGDAVSSALDTGELLDVEVEEIAWVSALVTLDRRRRGEWGPAETMAVEEAGDGSPWPAWWHGRSGRCQSCSRCCRLSSRER